jgi:Phage integrase, N-terminal SAM-like domain/Arm DNA-binding domain
MRGFVRKRGSTYTWYFDVPDPVTSKRRQYSKGGFLTKKECQHALNEALAALRTGTFVEPSQRTVAGFLVEEWLPAMRPPRVRPSTWLSYQRNVERHIVPALGHLPLQRLTPAQLTAFYRGLLETGHRKGSGGLAPKTVRNIHGALHAALRDAVRWGYVAPATSLWRPTSPRAWRRRCASGPRSSSAPSSITSKATGCTPPGCCYATAALAAGIPAKIVSERLGHATIAITMDTYSHVLPGLDEQAAGTVAQLILGKPRRQQPSDDKPLTRGLGPPASERR